MNGALAGSSRASSARALRHGREVEVLGLPVLGEPEVVAEPPARGREVGLLDAVVGVVGLVAARAEGGDRDHPAGLGRHGDAGVVDRAGLLRPGREVGAGLVEGGVAEVGVLVAERGDRRDAVAPGEVDRPLGGHPDGELLELLLRRVGRVVEAVEEPGVGEEAHVDDVDPDQPGVHDRVHRRLQEEEPGVLPGPDVDQRDLGRDAGSAEPVEGGRHQAGHVGAVPVLVHVRRVVARLVRLVLTGAVDQRDVGREVAAQPRG